MNIIGLSKERVLVRVTVTRDKVQLLTFEYCLRPLCATSGMLPRERRTLRDLGVPFKEQAKPRPLDEMGNKQSNHHAPPTGEHELSTKSSDERNLSTSDSEGSSPTPIPRGASLLNDLLDLGSSPFTAPPSAQPPRVSDKLQLLDDEESVNLDEFDLDGFTQEEVNSYNSMAEPGQRLQDAVSPQKMQSLIRNATSGLPYVY